MSRKDKDLIVTVDDKQYSFNSIIQRTIHAPINKINVERLMHCKPSGVKAIDSSDLRVCRIDKEWKVLTGFDKVKAVVEAMFKSRQRGDPVAEDNPPDVMIAKVMSLSYLESTALSPEKEIPKAKPKVTSVIPTKESIAARLLEAGFRVRQA